MSNNRSGNERPTLHTVALAAGVSTSTVSQVLRGRGRISDHTRRKVMRTVEEINYVQDRRAAAMRSGESRDIGLLIHNIANPFNAEVVVGANAHLQEHGYLVYVLDALDDVNRQGRYLRTMLAGSPSGLLWVPALETEKQTVEWIKSLCPVTVTFLRSLADHPFDHVGIDSTYGSMIATRHLLELGHKRIAFLGGNYNSETLHCRIGGYVSALMAESTANPLVRVCPETKADALQATIDLLRDHRDITGIVCNCDVIAAGAMLGIARLGMTVGEDVSVVGFDDIEDAKLWSPPLTTISSDPKGIGQQLAETFLARRENRHAPMRTVTLPVRLQVRASSGPPQEGALDEGY